MIDAHNHLQDKRLTHDLDEIVESLQAAGIQKWTVNGTCEEDWPRVAKLAEDYPHFVVPQFGLHPWFVLERTDRWESLLRSHLKRFPTAGVGEIGIDKWVRDIPLSDQQPIFEAQLRIAAEQNRTATIHCLKAFGRLHEILTRSPRPKNFLLHSYSGPSEMVNDFLEFGAYFSFSGHFLHARKSAQRDVFRNLPIERLLLETDAPEMPLPNDESPYNHPKNLVAIYQFVAELRGMDVIELVDQCSRNYANWLSL